jgi:hypothetical protein
MSVVSNPAALSRRAMPDRQTTEERAQIKHELEMLRTRHALMMMRSGRARRIFVRLVSAIAVAGTLLYAFAADVALGINLIGVAAGALWIGRNTIHRRERDHVVLPPSKFYPLTSFSRTWSFPKGKGAAETIEDMIAAREKRLAELTSASSP